jgi:thymidylate synthase
MARYHYSPPSAPFGVALPKSCSGSFRYDVVLSFVSISPLSCSSLDSPTLLSYCPPYIQGNTNGNDLAAKDIHIWDGNGSREFLDQRGLSHREVGDLGPVYGFQWRHFGAKYVDMHTDYTGQGVDQLAECIEKIKNNPEDRRIIMSAWNPADLNQMALPPCHMFCQFYVS